MNNPIYFPIKTATACQSKWSWSTIYLNQRATASCHRVSPVRFDLDNFDNFHNLPKKLEDRRLMLEGKWPTGGCEYCKQIEDAGGFSDRMHNLDIPGLTPPEVIADQSAIVVTPQIVEIFAQNTCNLACIYCNANLSSKIEQENKKHGEFNNSGVRIPVIDTTNTETDKYFNKFLGWLEINIQSLKRLHLLGGETFLQHTLMESILDIVERKPNPELEFCVFSNFNVPDKYWNLYTSRIQNLQKSGNIKRFDLTASIDCWGPEASYVRSGLNLEKFEERLDWAARQDPESIYLNVNQTITAMTIKTMPELIQKINQYSKNRPIGQYFEFVTGYPFQHPEIFAYGQWENDFKRIFETIRDDGTIEQRQLIQRMQGIDNHLKQKQNNNYVLINKLKVYLDELDRRRGTDWRSLFGYLDI